MTPKKFPTFLPRINTNETPTYARPEKPPTPPSRSRYLQYWVYEKPPDRAEYLLLTVERKVTSGFWFGQVGDQFIAYAPMPRPNKGIEKQLISQGKIKR